MILQKYFRMKLVRNSFTRKWVIDSIRTSSIRNRKGFSICSLSKSFDIILGIWSRKKSVQSDQKCRISILPKCYCHNSYSAFSDPVDHTRYSTFRSPPRIFIVSITVSLNAISQKYYNASRLNSASLKNLKWVNCFLLKLKGYYYILALQKTKVQTGSTISIQTLNFRDH